MSHMHQSAPNSYLPTAFAAGPMGAARVMKSHPFATLISVHNGQIFVSQLPLIQTSERILIGHLARMNPHAQALLDTGEPVSATVQFTGANGYISPAWYTHNTGVPTWNYETVLVRGALKIMHGAQATEQVVKSLIDAFDAQADEVKQAWADSPLAAQTAQLAAIVAFEITIEHQHAKSKLSQNRSAKDRLATIAALEQGSQNDQQVAKAMRECMVGVAPAE